MLTIKIIISGFINQTRGKGGNLEERNNLWVFTSSGCQWERLKYQLTYCGYLIIIRKTLSNILLMINSSKSKRFILKNLCRTFCILKFCYADMLENSVTVEWVISIDQTNRPRFLLRWIALIFAKSIDLLIKEHEFLKTYFQFQFNFNSSAFK